MTTVRNDGIEGGEGGKGQNWNLEADERSVGLVETCSFIHRPVLNDPQGVEPRIDHRTELIAGTGGLVYLEDGV